MSLYALGGVVDACGGPGGVGVGGFGAVGEVGFHVLSQGVDEGEVGFLCVVFVEDGADLFEVDLAEVGVGEEGFGEIAAGAPPGGGAAEGVHAAVLRAVGAGGLVAFHAVGEGHVGEDGVVGDAVVVAPGLVAVPGDEQPLVRLGVVIGVVVVEEAVPVGEDHVEREEVGGVL